MSKNIGKSISDKLRNVAKQKKVDFQLMIIRYLYERLLYRLSQSPYKNHLYLKGGVLLYIIGQDYARPTLDIDFMGHHVNHGQNV